MSRPTAVICGCGGHPLRLQLKAVVLLEGAAFPMPLEEQHAVQVCTSQLQGTDLDLRICTGVPAAPGTVADCCCWPPSTPQDVLLRIILEFWTWRGSQPLTEDILAQGLQGAGLRRRRTLLQAPANRTNDQWWPGAVAVPQSAPKIGILAYGAVGGRRGRASPAAGMDGSWQSCRCLGLVCSTFINTLCSPLLPPAVDSAVNASLTARAISDLQEESASGNLTRLVQAQGALLLPLPAPANPAAHLALCS